MEWTIDDDRPIYAQLMEQMEQAVVCGGFQPGQRLPGVRELAADAGVNPNTMQRALAELEAKGLVQSRRTSGRFVTEDAAEIARMRGQLAREEAGRFYRAMKALGCSDDEIDGAIRQAKEENQ